MTTQTHEKTIILRRNQVEARTGLRRSTIYDHIKTGAFPSPIKLGAKSVGWIEAEINAWLEARINDSRKA